MPNVLFALKGAATLAKQGINGKAEVAKSILPGLDSIQESAESNLQRRSSGGTLPSSQFVPSQFLLLLEVCQQFR